MVSEIKSNLHDAHKFHKFESIETRARMKSNIQPDHLVYMIPAQII